MKITEEDAKLTALVLEQLSQEEAARLRQLIDSNEQLALEVAELSSLAGMIQEGYAAEPNLQLTPDQHLQLISRLPIDDPTETNRSIFGAFSGVFAVAAALMLLVWTRPVVKDDENTGVPKDLTAFVNPESKPLSNAISKSGSPVGNSSNPEQPLAYSYKKSSPQVGARLKIRDEYTFVNLQPIAAVPIRRQNDSYLKVREALITGHLPAAKDVRIDEMIQHFDLVDDHQGRDLAVNAEIAPSPWNAAHQLLRIALQAPRVPQVARTPLNAVMLIDVSSSMNEQAKLPAFRRAFKSFVENLNARDHVAIVNFGGAEGIALSPTTGDRHQVILDAMTKARGGSVIDGFDYMQLAYHLADESYDARKKNKIILVTDEVDAQKISDTVEKLGRVKASQIDLTVLHVGESEKVAVKSDFKRLNRRNTYAQISTQKQWKTQLFQSINTPVKETARGVVTDIEFNPEQVQAYRLLGYQRVNSNDDIAEDKSARPSQDFSQGDRYVALYEIVPPGVELDEKAPRLKYQHPQVKSAEIATVKVRFEDGRGRRVIDHVVSKVQENFRAASDNFRFSAAVAGFGLLLRNSPFKGKANFDQITKIAKEALGDDRHGYRRDFLALVRSASRSQIWQK